MQNVVIEKAYHFVPPRHGRERFERMVLLVAVAILVLIPVLTIFMTNLFLKQ